MNRARVLVRMRRGARLLASVAVLLAVAAPALAFGLRGGVVSSGAQNSSDAALTLRGTVGQPAVGGSAGASFFACHGFWCFGGTRVLSVDWEPGGRGNGNALPTEVQFGPPTPNPTRGLARFTLALPRDADVTFEVLDVAGRRLGDVVRERLGAGRHELRWSAPTAKAGVYFGQLTVDGDRPMRKRIVLVR